MIQSRHPQYVVHRHKGRLNSVNYLLSDGSLARIYSPKNWKLVEFNNLRESLCRYYILIIIYLNYTNLLSLCTIILNYMGGI